MSGEAEINVQMNDEHKKVEEEQANKRDYKL